MIILTETKSFNKNAFYSQYLSLEQLNSWGNVSHGGKPIIPPRKKERKKKLEWIPKVRQVITLSLTIAGHTALKGAELLPRVAHATD